jgi:polar amino acid transport system substrate-binding protein
MSRRQSFAVFLFIFFVIVVPSHAQDDKPKLRVATRIIPPFVMEDGDKLKGFSIDLWRNIADELDLQYEFSVKSSVGSLIDAVKSGRADVGIAAVSITSERDKVVDFSQPIFDSGLQILVPRPSRGAAD